MMAQLAMILYISTIRLVLFLPTSTEYTQDKGQRLRTRFLRISFEHQDLGFHMVLAREATNPSLIRSRCKKMPRYRRVSLCDEAKMSSWDSSIFNRLYIKDFYLPSLNER